MPRKRRTIEVQWPVGGVNNRYAYQKQPPYTCVEAQNVRTEGTFEARRRGGSRPGLVKALPTQVAGASTGAPFAIQMLDVVHSVQTAPTPSQLTENFADALAAPWTNGSAGTMSETLTVLSGTGYDGASGGKIGVAWLDPTNAGFGDTGMDTDKSLTVSYTIPVNTKSYANDWRSEYFIFFKMDDSSPDIDTCVVARCRLNYAWQTGGHSVFLFVYTGIETVGTVPRTIAFDDMLSGGSTFGLGSTPRWDDEDIVFSATLEPGGVVRASFHSATRTPRSIECNAAAVLDSFTGDRFGIGAWRDNHIAYLDDCIIDYVQKASLSNTPPIRIVAAANGEIWREELDASDDQILDDDPTNPNSLDLNSTSYISTVERFGTLYMADHGVRSSGTGVVTNGVLTSDTLTDDDFANADVNGDYLELTSVVGGTGNCANGTWRMSSTTDDTATITGWGASEDCTSCSFRLVRAPKTYDSDADTVGRLSNLDSDGSDTALPLNCKIITLYRDRLVLAGDDDSPHIWGMSRQGNPNDWYASGLVTDGGRPIKGTVDESGVVSKALTALVPATEDYLIFAAADAMWILRGDPAMQGFIDVLSSSVGIIDRRAWALTPDGVLYFLSKDGLYKVLPGPTQYPVAVSRDALPLSLTSIDTESVTASLLYDIQARALHIYLTPVVEKLAQRHYWFNVDDQAFWPMTMYEDHEPVAVALHEQTSGALNRVILGGRTGYIYQYSPQVADDDGIAFQSRVILGPFGVAGVSTMIRRLRAVLDGMSSDVDVLILTGDDPESALSTVGESLDAWSSGANTWTDVRRAAGAIYLQLESSSRWAIDSLLVELEPVAEWRPL